MQSSSPDIKPMRDNAAPAAAQHGSHHGSHQSGAAQAATSANFFTDWCDTSHLCLQASSGSIISLAAMPGRVPLWISTNLHWILALRRRESGRYTVSEVIGKGSYGVVCMCTDNLTNERVAIKKIQNVFDNVADATRILREIKLLRLLKHPGASATAGGSSSSSLNAAGCVVSCWPHMMCSSLH
jgi:serine/threonine protein kinase